MKLNKPLYYLLNCTWGIIMNLIGALIALGALICGIKPKKHAGSIYFQFGKGWGGVSFGCFFFCDTNSSNRTKNHEFGHSLQNCLWGPLFPFIIAIPSAIRYHKFMNNTRKGIPNKESYDAIWFEGQATKWGTKVAAEWDK